MLRWLYTLLWVLMFAGIVGWGSVRFAVSDLAAIMGALGCYVVGALALMCYIRVIRPRHLTGMDVDQQLEVGKTHLHWLLIAANSFFPGMWIGATARSPLQIVAVYLALFLGLPYLFRALIRTLGASDAPRQPKEIERIFFNTALMLIGAIAGVSAHSLLSQ
jgi:hypothetical protein